MSECQKLSLDTLSDYQDGALSWIRAWQVRTHLNRCAECKERWQTVQHVGQAVQEWFAESSPSNAMYARVQAQVGTVNTKSRSLIPIRQWATAGGVALLVAGGAFLIQPRAVVTPAFAEVTAAMEKVRTARWQVHFSEYKEPPNRPWRADVQYYARLDRPMLRYELPEGYVRIDTPEGTLQRTVVKDNPKKRRETFMSPSKVYPNKSRVEIAEMLRDSITKDILYTDHWIPKSKPAKYTRIQKETIQGREMIRFEMGDLSQANSPRLTKPGYLRVIWADAKTKLIERIRQEYYDGNQHNIQISDGFRYNENLPESLFSLKPRNEE